MLLLWQSAAVLSAAGHKRVYLTDSKHSSLDEPLCRRYKSPVDDTVDFEMMLADVSSSGVNPTARPSSENGQTQPEEFVTVKSEPGCSSPDVVQTDSEPLNFCLSTNAAHDTNAAVDRTSRSSVDENRLHPSSSVTSAAGCTDLDSSRLQKELATAVSANLALQEELSARDFHLAQLAEDFFCLHEQFRQLARHFQAVLGDIQPLEDRPSVNRITQNHSSWNCAVYFAE